MRRLLVVLAALALALPAAGFVPKASRIAGAAAKANDSAARSQALRLDLTLRVGDRDPIGTGTLVTHPTGLARLELRDAADRTERHLLLGSEHSASRSGRTLERPRAFLPPLFFLQVDSPSTLRTALADFGLDVGAAGLEPCGEELCYVLGDRPRAVHVDDAGPKARPEPVEADGFLGSDVILRGLAETAPKAPVPRVWVDTKTFEIVRIESRSGVSVEFGPTVAFGEVRFPDSITIHEPEREVVRFDIQGVVPVNAPAAEFSPAWLLAPSEDENLEFNHPAGRGRD